MKLKIANHYYKYHKIREKESSLGLVNASFSQKPYVRSFIQHFLKS